MFDIEVESCQPHPHHCPPEEHCQPEEHRHREEHCHPCMKQDFILSEGVKVTVHKGQEVNHDFTLHPNMLKDFGTISGRVKDHCGHPIAHALVKVFDHKHRPFTHVFTNHDGEFLICVPPGHYILKAVR